VARDIGERGVLVAWSERKKGCGERRVATGAWWEGSGGGVQGVRVPHGVGRTWGLDPTGGWRPNDHGLAAAHAGGAALSEQGSADP
jgi:hypothetical protein